MMPNMKSKLLIVDDELLIRTSLSQIFAEFEYAVRSADDGFSALSEIRREIPDILLSDLNMERLSGFKLLSIIRGGFPSIQVVAMSGAFQGNEVPAGVAADAFYEKGSPSDSLIEIVEAMAQGRWFASRKPQDPAFPSGFGSQLTAGILTQLDASGLNR